MPLWPHEDLIGDLQCVVGVGEKPGILDDSGEGSVDAECLYTFWVDFFKVELLIFGEVLHVGLEEAELAGIPVLENHT